MKIIMKLKRFITLALSAILIVLSFSSCVYQGAQGGLSSKIKENSGKLVIHYIDVGQGDSEFIEFPNGTTMLIDAGESSYGEKVASTIKELGYDKIDIVVATHPHADHIGGLPYVFEEFDVRCVYLPDVVSSSKAFEKLLDAIDNEECTVNNAHSGLNIVSTDNIVAKLIAPVGDEYDNLNNYSAVIMVKYLENSFLFMGDAEKISENEITDDVSSGVIKVGHHGSKTASSQKFIEKVNPKYAIIEVGADNSYGHPNNDTMERFYKLKTEVLTTSEHGDITVISDGRTIDIETEK